MKVMIPLEGNEKNEDNQGREMKEVKRLIWSLLY